LLPSFHPSVFDGFRTQEDKLSYIRTALRNAILRIGAKQEGIFRKHVICDSGRVRDSVWFSVIDTEWPAVKTALETKLGLK